jgi:fucose 4-O-acetylase-like acetyltransferase
VSGFVSYKNCYKWDNLLRRFKQLMIPYVVWAICGWYLNLSCAPLWFLSCLFGINFVVIPLTIISNRLEIRNEFVLIPFSVGLYIFCHIFDAPNLLDSIAAFLRFYLLGFYARKYIDYIRISERVWICLFILFMIGTLFWNRNGSLSFLPLETPRFIIAILNDSIRLCGVLSIFFLSRKYLDTINNKLITKQLGGGTLGFYAIHCTIIIKLSLYLRTILGSLNDTTFITFLFIFVSLISILVYWLLSSNRYSAFLFLGKHF